MSPDNIAPCRGQHVALEPRVERVCDIVSSQSSNMQARYSERQPQLLSQNLKKYRRYHDS
jgi:hypothetical protein